LCGEVKLFSGRLRRDLGSVKKGRRISGGGSAHLEHLEGSGGENENTDSIDFDSTEGYVLL
jgi:hypothetical protein